MGAFASKEERAKVSSGAGPLNIVKHNYRGIVCFIVAVILMATLSRPEPANKSTLVAIWSSMFVYMLLRPMNPTASAIIPLFACPMLAISGSEDVCGALSNDNIMMFYLGGWLIMLLNNCGMDKRLVCMFLCAGDKDSFTPLKLLLKSCMAAFCVSAISERDLTTNVIMTYIIKALEPLKLVKNEVNYGELKAILCNAVAISSLLGSMTIMHASLTTLQLRAMHAEPAVPDTEYPDVFNYLNYSAFAIPTALIMFILNTIYEAFLVSKYAATKPMNPFNRETLQKTFAKYQSDLGSITNHELVSCLFLVASLAVFFSRWSPWMNMGWATFAGYGEAAPDVCRIKDATAAAIFIVVLHMLPKSLNFLKIWTVSRQGDMPQMKPESGILFWKFVDKNTDYSLFLLFGAGAIIYKGIFTTGLAADIPGSIGNTITGLGWIGGVFVVVLVSVLLGTIMTGMSAQACLMPLMLVISMTGPDKWPGRRNLVALGVGLGTGLGFCLPFEHSPSAFVKTKAKVALKKQVMYSIVSTIICMVVLWLMLCFFAPVLWDPEDKGIFAQALPGGAVVTTAAPEGAGTEAPTEAPAL